ncbi:hypothetical protein B5G50_08160 [Brevibacillus brevis]|nr:hypothetical protein B5G50_08160 [Brevibacillus brevis]
MSLGKEGLGTERGESSFSLLFLDSAVFSSSKDGYSSYKVSETSVEMGDLLYKRYKRYKRYKMKKRHLCRFRNHYMVDPIGIEPTTS